uniref:Dynein heavy chain hydrolytic ATP-binding dynein motor region domain-containing protein n=1 Tax=Timema monikensis TaxID=170555 RepID=A0A7R9E7N2_9NEOP|nr:unnamed protein product [Timema monikensis]
MYHLAVSVSLATCVTTRSTWNLKGIQLDMQLAKTSLMSASGHQSRSTTEPDAKSDIWSNAGKGGFEPPRPPSYGLGDMNLPKFVFDDVPLFLGLITDLFPGLDCPRVGYPEFNTAVVRVLQEYGYVVLPDQVDKVVQLYETMMTRHSTMIVGPTGGGKTVVIQILVQAQIALGLFTKLFILNPKACSVIELYGILDPVTRDWTDGLLSCIFREINKPTDRKEKRYILFDGDVDALWIENMNSVMDDNKLLTLANGERVRLQPHCALLFEVGDLQYASPATVSRAGMVYVDPKNLGYDPFWERWLSERPSLEEREELGALYQRYVPGSVLLIKEGVVGVAQQDPLKTIIPQTALNMLPIRGLPISPKSGDGHQTYTNHFLEVAPLVCQMFVAEIGYG